MPRSTNSPTSPQARGTSMPLMSRLMPVSSFNADARTVDVTWTAGAQVAHPVVSRDLRAGRPRHVYRARIGVER